MTDKVSSLIWSEGMFASLQLQGSRDRSDAAYAQ